MAVSQKYLFDVSFDHVDEKPAPVVEVVEEEKFSRAEIEAARQIALAEGRGVGLAEANEGAAAKSAATLDALAKGVVALLSTRDTQTAEIQRQAIAALRAVIAKALPALAAKEPLAEIEAFATKCLNEAIDEPRIVLRVANGVYDAVRGQLDAIAAASGYAGRIVLLADDQLANGDARIEWADGGAERSLGAQLDELNAAMARLCDPAATPAPLPPPRR